MQTRCPSCDTHFRVTPAQIKVRAGTVRCGRCSFVFNALDTLVEDISITNTIVAPYDLPSELPTTTEQTSTFLDEEIDTVVADDAVDEVIDETNGGGADEISDGTSVIDPGGDSVEAAPEIMAAEIAAEAETEHEPAPARKILDDTLDIPEESDPPPPTLDDYLANPYVHDTHVPSSSWPWVLGTAVVVLGLLLQATYYYRVELAVWRPELRPILQAACQPFNCEVPRPRYVDNLSIESSDLRPDPQQPGHLTLTATLHSKASFAQEWPMLELTLTDVNDNKLAVKHFSARDYLPKDKNYKRAIADGFSANGELAIALPLDVGALPAAGYRLYVFYP
jgi:predicted Zn finger-like uncharacterized protein